MNFIKRNVLTMHSDLIIKDLHGDVIEILRDKGVLSVEEFEKINAVKKHEEINKKFLEILYTKPDGFNALLDSLKDWYGWIEEKLRNTLTARPSTLGEAIALSKVPAIPLINVSRVDLLEQVRKALMTLNKGEYVVLHGMSGCGKSSLAAEALHHEILLSCFQGRVVWLSCGHDVKDDENKVLALQIELNAAICDEELVSDVKTATIKSLRFNLQRRFQLSDFKDGLVVLDDVNSYHVIEALNIGCKTLVTTIGKDVMKEKGSRCSFIEVSESFKEEETMQYLAKCVSVSVNKLPAQAPLIHRYGKGHPMIMSLIGAHLKDHRDESQRQDDNWEEWLNVLRKKEYGELKRRSFTNEPLLPQTIEICINNLAPEMREMYQDFALFVEDVNIKVEVLEILWNLPKNKVKKVMNEFYTKSLVVRKYNEAQTSYVYGIHDLLRFFLRQRLDEDALKKLHVKLIDRYKEVCDGDLSKLPRNDNYFFYYIGYHIANSKQYAMFQELYFNLDFIEAKLKVAGPGDLLLDYKRYSCHFVDGLYETSATAIAKRLSDFVRFVETAGLDIKRNNGPDIVQLGLQESHDSDVYKIALRLAQSRPQKTYLRFQLGPSKSKAAPHTIQTREKVSSACFSNNNNNLIVGFESGTIQIVNERGHKLREYEGHTSEVTRLNMSSQKNIFLSVSSLAVKLWKLPDLDFNVASYQGEGDRSPSPNQRQDNFAELFACKSPEKRKSCFTVPYKGEVQWACFSPDGSNFAVCCTQDNKVELYQPNDPYGLDENKQSWIVFPTMHVSKPTSCVFSTDARFIAIGSNDSYVRVHQMNNGLIFRKVISYPILSLFALPGIKFGVLTRASLSVWDLEDLDLANVVNKVPVPCLKDYTKGESELYTSCATAADGSVVAVATSNSKILICDPGNGSVIREIHESTGNIKYLAMDETKDRRLLACYDDSTVRIWKLGEVHIDRRATMRSNFVVTWTGSGLSTLVAPTLKPCVKKITNLKTSEYLHVPASGDINICGISDCGRYTAIGTPTGQVFLHREGSTVELVTVVGSDSIIKLSVKNIRNRIYVVVGLKRSLKVWSGKEKSDIEKEDKSKFIYYKFKNVQFALSDRLVNFFILPTEELISVSKMGNIKKWCLKEGRHSVVCHGRLDDRDLCAAGLSCDNVLVTLDCATSKPSISFYNVADTVTEEQSFRVDSGIPCCCSFSCDGRKLAVGLSNGVIQLWDMMTLECTSVFTGKEPIECVCVSRTGVIGAATLARIVLVTATGAVGQARLRVTKVVMSPDDDTIITVDVDGHLHLIDQFNSSNCSSVRLTRAFSNV